MRTSEEMTNFCFKWEDLSDPDVRDRLVTKLMEQAKEKREEAVRRGKKPDSFWYGAGEHLLTYDGALKSLKNERETNMNCWIYVTTLFEPIETLLQPGIGQPPNPNDEVIYAFLSVGMGLKHRITDEIQKVNVAVALTRNRCIIADSTKNGKKGQSAIKIISYDDILKVYFDTKKLRVIFNTTSGNDVGFYPSGNVGSMIKWTDEEHPNEIDNAINLSLITEIIENYKNGVQHEAPQATPQPSQPSPQTKSQPPQAAVPTAPPAKAGLSVEAVETLKQFKELLDAEIITQEEFDAKKKQLLGL